jgi:hypothetical protein
MDKSRILRTNQSSIFVEALVFLPESEREAPIAKMLAKRLGGLHNALLDQREFSSSFPSNVKLNLAKRQRTMTCSSSEQAKTFR